jgi:hypothetical protein
MTQEQGQRPRETRAGKPERPSAVLIYCRAFSRPTRPRESFEKSGEWGVGSGEWGADILERRFVRVC